MERKILPSCLKGKHGCHLGEFNNTSIVMFGAESVSKLRHFANYAHFCEIHSLVGAKCNVCVELMSHCLTE